MTGPATPRTPGTPGTPGTAAGDGDGYAARRAEALALLAGGDPDAAFRAFRAEAALPPRPGIAPDRLADAAGVLARILVALGHRDLADLCARVSTDVHDPDALYELGYQLIEAGLPDVAAGVLRRCLDVVPGSEQVVTELVAALERTLDYRAAMELLAAHPQLVADSFLCRYLYAYDAAMCGELAITREVAPGLTPADETQAFMAARIERLLARADRVDGAAPLDDRDLRGWHYVLTGGVLLHRSPYGFDGAMRGRYAWLQDSYELVRHGLGGLAAALAAWGEAPPCVYAPPGRDHEVVAEAAARALGVPRAPWPAVGVPAPGLVVAYDLADVEWRDLERLVERRPGQILFAHASQWTVDGPVAPDVTTLLHQSIVSPWGERLVARPGEGTTTRPADDRAADALADEILAAPALDGEAASCDDRPGLAALVAAAGAPAPGRRERLWAGSPVASNRFV